jgi:hypothetical protein
MKPIVVCLFLVLTPALIFTQERPDPFGDGHLLYPRGYSGPDSPSLKDLRNLETKFWQARAGGNADVLKQLVNDNAIIATSTGAVKKSELIAQVESGACEIKSYNLQDFILKPSAPTAFVISYRAQQDGVCNGKPLPHSLNITASFIRSQSKLLNGQWWPGKWQSISHEETPATSH